MICWPPSHYVVSTGFTSKCLCHCSYLSLKSLPIHSVHTITFSFISVYACCVYFAISFCTRGGTTIQSFLSCSDSYLQSLCRLRTWPQVSFTWFSSNGYPTQSTLSIYPCSICQLNIYLRACVFILYIDTRFIFTTDICYLCHFIRWIEVNNMQWC